MAKKKGFLQGLSLVAPEREVRGFGTIQSGNISIGPMGLVVDGKNCSVINSLDELQDLNKELGRGASGTVRKVSHPAAGRIFAVKALSLESVSEFLEKKLIELKCLHACKHQNIVGFFGAFYNDGTLSFLLEFMDRGTIADLLAQLDGPVPEAILARMTREMLLGLEYLHKMHIIHRDFKPQNILLNSSGELKIADFGVSGEIANTAAFANTFAGTIKYMSPTRIKGTPHSTKSDIWSLGLVILECALGAYPYGDDTPQTTFFSRLNDIVNQPVPLPAPGQFSTEFDSFIVACLQKEEEKLPTCSELLHHPWLVQASDGNSSILKEWIKTNS